MERQNSGGNRGTPRVDPPGGLIVLDDGTVLGRFTQMNFLGAGVTASPDGVDPRQVNVLIPGGAVGSDTNQLEWGNDSIATSTATRFLNPYSTDSMAPIVLVEFRLIRAATLRNLRIRHRTAGGNASVITYTVLVGGVATAITASIAANDPSLQTQDLVNSVAVAAGALIGLRVTKAAAIGASPRDITATLEAA